MSTTSKYTPGEWKAVQNDNVDYDCPEIIARNGATCIAARLGSGSEAWANAKLIALAPEMYEALKDLLAPLTKPEIDECWQYKQAAAILAKLEKE